MLVAHAGHWAVGILYTIPVFAVLIALRVSIVRERRREAEGDAGESSAADGPDGPADGLVGLDGSVDGLAADPDEPLATPDDSGR